jgi:small-conductance mechanosensitive channel
VVGFIEACRGGDYELAAHYLRLDHLAEPAQRQQGSRLARRFKLVLDQKLWVDPDAVSDAQEGQGDDELPLDQDQIGAIPLGGGEQGIRVQRLTLPDGEQAWVFSANVVRAIDPLYDEYGMGWFGDNLPLWMFRYRVWELELWQLLGLVLLLPVAYLVARVVAHVVVSLLLSTASRTQSKWDDELSEMARRPLRLLLWAALVGLGSTGLHLSQPAQELVGVLARTGMLVALGLFGHSAVAVAAGALEAQLVRSQADERKRKGVATQVVVMQRIASGAVILLVTALVLAQFQVMRTVGLSLLASAGLAGIILGFAAQRSVANLFAAIQIMLTQPIRIDDVVVVEGEWGTIEEITFANVVVKIWDLRRLVVPIGYFLEHPFQNWTRASTELLGTIYFYTDHTVDVDAMRAELDRILAETDLWDGKASGILVTGLKDHVAEVRAMISAEDSSKQWGLRCLVREKLLDWLQREGKSLPTFRVQTQGGGGVLPPG